MTEDEITSTVEGITGLPKWKDGTPESRRGMVREFAIRAQQLEVPADELNPMAAALYDKADSKGLTGWAGLLAEEGLKSIPAGGAAIAGALTDLTGMTDTGSGQRLLGGLYGSTESLLQQIKSLHPDDEQERRDAVFGKLRESIDSNDYPDGLEVYLTGAGPSPEGQKYWEQWQDLTLRSSISAAEGRDMVPRLFVDQATAQRGLYDPRAKELLADYMATRDPQSWEALTQLGTETMLQFSQRKKQEADAGTPEMMRRAIEAEGRQPTLLEDLAMRSGEFQTSPIDMAMSLFPLIKGGQALAAARGGRIRQALARAGEGVTGEFISGAASEMLADPRNTWQDIAQAGAMEAGSAGIITGGGALMGRVMRGIDLRRTERQGQTGPDAVTQDPMMPGAAPVAGTGESGMAPGESGMAPVTEGMQLSRVPIEAVPPVASTPGPQEMAPEVIPPVDRLEPVPAVEMTAPVEPASDPVEPASAPVEAAVPEMPALEGLDASLMAIPEADQPVVPAVEAMAPVAPAQEVSRMPDPMALPETYAAAVDSRNAPALTQEQSDAQKTLLQLREQLTAVNNRITEFKKTAPKDPNKSKNPKKRQEWWSLIGIKSSIIGQIDFFEQKAKDPEWKYVSNVSEKDDAASEQNDGDIQEDSSRKGFERYDAVEGMLRKGVSVQTPGLEGIDDVSIKLTSSSAAGSQYLESVFRSSDPKLLERFPDAEERDPGEYELVVKVRLANHQATESARSTPDVDIRFADSEPQGAARRGKVYVSPDAAFNTLDDAVQNLIKVAAKKYGIRGEAPGFDILDRAPKNQNPDIAAGVSEPGGSLAGGNQGSLDSPAGSNPQAAVAVNENPQAVDTAGAVVPVAAPVEAAEPVAPLAAAVEIRTFSPRGKMQTETVQVTQTELTAFTRARQGLRAILNCLDA